MDIARTLADGGKEVVGALDKRIDDITNTISHARTASRRNDRRQVGDIDRTLGNRALEVAGTLDDRIGKFELLIRRAEKLSERSRNAHRAATSALDASNNAIRNSTVKSRAHADDGLLRRGRGAQAECEQWNTP